MANDAENPLSSANDDWTGDPKIDRARLVARAKRVADKRTVTWSVPASVELTPDAARALLRLVKSAARRRGESDEDLRARQPVDRLAMQHLDATLTKAVDWIDQGRIDEPFEPPDVGELLRGNFDLVDELAPVPPDEERLNAPAIAALIEASPPFSDADIASAAALASRLDAAQSEIDDDDA